MAFATSSGIIDGAPFEFKSSAAETATATHKSVRIGSGGPVVVTVNVTAFSGTTPTLAVVVEGSNDGSTWVTLGQLGANGYSLGSVATAPSNITGTATVSGVFPALTYVRTRSVVGGTTPSFTYSVEAAIL